MADNGSETKSGAKGPAYTPKTENQFKSLLPIVQ